MSARFGRYQLLRPLGAGGMAEVFLARYVGPEGFEKRLVIKRVLPRYAGDQRLLRMFFEEARTHVSLSHGNLVPVFDFGRVGNEYFIAMEHVRGADLATVLGPRSARRPLAPAIAAYVGVELCRGLAYVHRRGFVHRDVSPRNVLLSVDGEVKLSDFGLVSSLQQGGDGDVRGTLAYTPPEQARGERVDGRGDLFSLGVVLAEALTGGRLRDADSDESALRIARAGEPIAVAGPLGEIVARATRTTPGERFTSAEEMLAALEREAAALGGGREASVRELAARVAEVARDENDGDAQRGSDTPAAEPVVSGDAPTVDGANASRAAATVDGGAATAGADPTADFRGGRGKSAPSSAETYYRGNESEAFVDEVLAQLPPARRRSPLPWLLASAAAVLLTGGLAFRAAFSSTNNAAAQNPAPNNAATQNPAPAPKPASPNPPINDAQNAQPANPPKPPVVEAKAAAHPPHHAAARETGTLLIQCTPWCIPFVDGARRGDDRKNHALTLPAGRHRVEVRRLDDHLAREVQVAAGRSETASFQFP